MATAQEIYAHILPAVRIIMAELNGAPDASSVEERIAARIWPHITHAVREIDPSALDNPTPKRDARSKPWQYVIRFWHVTELGNDLVAESDAEIMQGTGPLPAIVAKYGREMHSPEPNDGVTLFPDHLPAELAEESVKSKLAQLRNNLGRQGSAVLRIPYDIGNDRFICQVDVTSLDA